MHCRVSLRRDPRAGWMLQTQWVIFLLEFLVVEEVRVWVWACFFFSFSFVFLFRLDSFVDFLSTRSVQYWLNS